MYKARTYRNWVRSEDLVTFEVIEKETDLLISAVKDLAGKARGSVLTYRKDLEDYIKGDGAFYASLEPVNIRNGAPDIVKAMAQAAESANVGPMAAVAGAMAQFVGRDPYRSLSHCSCRLPSLSRNCRLRSSLSLPFLLPCPRHPFPR